MKGLVRLKAALAMSSCVAIAASAAQAENFNIPAGDLSAALDRYTQQTGVSLIVSGDAVRGVRTKGVHGDLNPESALGRILNGTGFDVQRRPSGALMIVPGAPASSSSAAEIAPMQLAQATPARTAVETVTVTSSKLGGADVQSIPIAITALSQEQLTATQTAGGPDLVKQVPNLTFTKTNFTGYSIQIRGIGTQAISVTTDPAVAVAFNDIPFIRNHFFEQEFYDVGQLEVLRGPQGTLYGRNATAGVVNLVSAKPTDQFEAMASAELGNYHQRRFEGMINIPIVDDRLDIRLAGEWTKRQGYSFNSLTDERIDGRDLWSGRVTIGWKPVENLQAYLVWEHYSEDDDRMRTAKQLCHKAPNPTEVNGIPVNTTLKGGAFGSYTYTNQGCVPASLYSPDSFETPNGYSLPFYGPTENIGSPVFGQIDPYASATQSRNLHVVETTLDPVYKAKNDIVELNADYHITPELTFTSQTGFNHDFLWSTEDYNRFNTKPGVFDTTTFGGDLVQSGVIVPDGNYLCADETLSLGGNHCATQPQFAVPTGYFCDPQLGCSNRLVLQDLSEERSWQLSQEFRLASKFSGPLNFSVGGNYMHYETHENYYVFINTITVAALNGFGSANHESKPAHPYVPGVTDNFSCLPNGPQAGDPNRAAHAFGCTYIDPNPIGHLNSQGHNYFLSQNPYVLNSYAAFGEIYYDVFNDLKLTGGLRWTSDHKHFPLIPSWFATADSYGYPVAGVVDQQWNELTGRFAANWTPKLSFTDQTLIYGSYAHGYKAGGANPPPAVPTNFGAGNAEFGSVTHPRTFDPEFIDAFELGTKNTLLDGALTLNGNLFYYNYEDYQISEIVDRTAINQNFNAHVTGAEIEATWEPVPGLRFNFGGGYENARLAKGSKAIDLMDRADLANHPDWMVVKPFPTIPSNCILPQYYFVNGIGGGALGLCSPYETLSNIDPITGLDYVANPTVAAPGHTIPPNYPGFYSADPAINGGEGFFKDIGGNTMPNAPPFTASLGAQYSMPVTTDWAATLRADGYWQDNSWWRVFNDLQYDKLHGYATLNLALILTSQSGWQVMLFDKNVFNTTAITGAFLNSDDSGLTTNVFLTDPKLIGIRVTKNW
jgi:outer membrane receptor protein involved in Fe transport